MKTLFPSATACFVVAFVASVGLAESQIEAAAESDEAVAIVETKGDSDSKPVSESEPGKKTTSDGEHGDSSEVDGAPPEKAKRNELSVAPMSHITYPDDRPSWIGKSPDLKSSVHTWVVTTSGCESMERCEAELEVLKPAAVSLYIKETTGWTCDDEFLDADWIEDDLVVRRYVGSLKKGDQTLNEIAVELNFDSGSRERIQRARKNTVVHDRLRATAGAFALALVGLCCTGGLLGLVSRRYS
jgi:hypothetical protein